MAHLVASARSVCDNYCGCFFGVLMVRSNGLLWSLHRRENMYCRDSRYGGDADFDGVSNLPDTDSARDSWLILSGLLHYWRSYL